MTLRLFHDYPPGETTTISCDYSTTIPEAVTTIPAGTPRLLLALIGYRAQARNGCGASRQGFRRRCPVCPLPLSTHARQQPAGRVYSRALAAGLHRRRADRTRPRAPRACMMDRRCPVQRPAWRWYLVSVEALRVAVCPPAWRRWYIGGLCICCAVCAVIGQIGGKGPARPCKRF